MFNPIDTPNYQQTFQQYGGSLRPQTRQPSPLTGVAPFNVMNPPDPNTTAPMSHIMDPAVQNMIIALQGGR